MIQSCKDCLQILHFSTAHCLLGREVMDFKILQEIAYKWIKIDLML